jgi:hypothetical protein
MKRIAIISAVLTLAGCCGPWEQLPINPEYDPDDWRVEEPAPPPAPASYSADPIDTEMPGTERTQVESRGTTYSDPR